MKIPQFMRIYLSMNKLHSEWKNAMGTIFAKWRNLKQSRIPSLLTRSHEEKITASTCHGKCHNNPSAVIEIDHIVFYALWIFFFMFRKTGY